jgi:hypothetical protein
MATPQALKTAIRDLAVLANNDLEALWRQVRTPDQARDALLDVLPGLATSYGAASATLSADWYDDIRDLVEAKGRFRAIPAEIGTGGSEELARWGVAPLYAPEPDWAAARTLIAGGLQRRIANGSRYTVAGSAVEDPAARGWMRVGAGGCDFCRMLIGRGAVYTEATADFESHDHCNCAAEPAWR